MTFAEFFRQATGHEPYPWQERLAAAEDWPLLLDVPTGAGKTAVILVWLWRLRFASGDVKRATPRRLAFCLPMRTLVEQTVKTVATWLEKTGLTAEVGCYQLMGGAVAKNWDVDPVQSCILIGTQDQLLSRALNRGYAMSRYRWPVQFALLNNDCLWVLDEVQLMGIGAKTAAQLQGLREKLGTYGPVKTLWMSATLDESVVKTVDHAVELAGRRLGLSEGDRQGALKDRFQAAKRLQPARTSLDAQNYASALAAEIIEQHQPGSLTLIVCNRVVRAQEVYQALQKHEQVKEDPLLVHSRFRAGDRQQLNQLLLSDNPTGIVVATQAIEAGIDLSARVLFTELAPRSSLVQRFGRCNRTGQQEDARIFWIDLPELESKAGKNLAIPYEVEELKRGREFLAALQAKGGDAGPQSLAEIEPDKSQPIPGQIPRQRDIEQLFDTSVDLAGHDIDVSRFIRQSEDLDVAIAWRQWEGKEPPADSPRLAAAELCRVSIGQAKKFFQDLEKKRQKLTDKKQEKLKKQLQPWVWSGMNRAWEAAPSIYPGQTILLPREAGGYDDKLGFTGNLNDRPTELWSQPDKPERKPSANDADASQTLSELGVDVELSAHSEHVAQKVQEWQQQFAECQRFQAENSPTSPDWPLLIRAGRWHDIGKAHAVFQARLRQNRADLPAETVWAKTAKAPPETTPAIAPQTETEPAESSPEQPERAEPKRKLFRHELASALAALDAGEDFLLAYLVAAHHGRARLTLQARPTETKPPDDRRYALGVWDGDPFPALDLGEGVASTGKSLSLECMELGGDSWTGQAMRELRKYGPFRLAFLEMLIRTADWAASRQEVEEAQARGQLTKAAAEEAIQVLEESDA